MTMKKRLSQFSVALLPIDESNTLFVKFRGPTEIAQKEQKNFIAFMASLRLLQNDAKQAD